MRKLALCIGLLAVSAATAAPPGFVQRTILLDAPPVGLAFDADGVLYALEAAPPNSNVATMRTILPDGSFGASFSVEGEASDDNFFVGSMAYDSVGDRLLVTNNTFDGWLYAIGKTGGKVVLNPNNPMPGAAGIAVRESGEIFVSTSPFFSTGEVLQVDRTNGEVISVLGNLGFGAGLAFDLDGHLIVQDANTSTFQGRLQRLPISETPSGLSFGTPVPLIENMQSSAGVTIDGEGDIFTTGSGGLYLVTGAPLVESSFDNNGGSFQFATAIALDHGTQPFEPFAGPNGGRLAYMADFGFSSQDEFITILTPARPGDYNADGKVDANDYNTWRSAFGSTGDSPADGNGDGFVDGGDYVVWRKNVPMASASSSATIALVVPEPMSILLIVIGLLPLIFALQRRPSWTAAGSVRSQAKWKE